jgi:mannitol/fructose-specific phosphotransferase system IIA component (Ntr-type)
MGLNDFLGPDAVVADLLATNRWEAIDELISHLVSSGKIPGQDRESIAASVKKRESSMTTAIGFGMAIPHASSVLVTDVVAAIGRSRTGIQFDALDGHPVKLVLLFVAPQGQFQQHLPILSNIAKLLHRSDFREGLGL